jgi:hypothetical protein
MVAPSYSVIILQLHSVVAPAKLSNANVSCAETSQPYGNDYYFCYYCMVSIRQVPS